jgi:hypothetical protein
MKYVIYKITIADYTYIGSTRDWQQRQMSHKHNFFNANSRAHNYKLYQTIRENGGWDAIEKSPIEEYECDGPIQAHIREEHWRREYNANMNAYRAHQTREERIDYCRDYRHEYNAAHREELNNRAREKIQCECGATICRSAKSTHLKSKKHTDLIAAQQQNITV